MSGQVFFKAVRPDGGSFRDPSFKWATEPGGVTRHPEQTKMSATDASFYLSVATVATDCTGMEWPCRLLGVEPIGDVWTPDAGGLPNKRAGLAFRTVRELPAHDVFGPQGVHVAALIARAGRLTREESDRMYAARCAAGDAARDAAWYAARCAAGDAARDVAWDVARDVAGDVARALIVRDLISAEHYDTLAMPWRTVVGRIHPDDAEAQS